MYVFQNSQIASNIYFWLIMELTLATCSIRKQHHIVPYTSGGC